MLDRESDPEELLKEGLRFHPANYGLQLTKARRELQFGDPAVSLNIACSLQVVDPENLIPGLIAYDRNIFGRYAAEMEIASLSRLGRLAEATRQVAAKAAKLKS